MPQDNTSKFCKHCGGVARDAGPGLLYKSSAPALKASPDDWTFSGLGATFEPPERHDFHGDIIDPGAFNDTIMESGPKPGKVSDIKHLWQHDDILPIGLPTKLEASARGLEFDGFLSHTEPNRERLVLMKDGVVNKNSIAYYSRAVEWLEDDRTVWGTPVRLLLKVDLVEISPVTFPANVFADILRVEGDETKARPMIEMKNGRLVCAGLVCTCDIAEHVTPPRELLPVAMRKLLNSELKSRFGFTYHAAKQKNAAADDDGKPPASDPKAGAAARDWLGDVVEQLVKKGRTRAEIMAEIDEQNMKSIVGLATVLDVPAESLEGQLIADLNGAGVPWLRSSPVAFVDERAFEEWRVEASKAITAATDSLAEAKTKLELVAPDPPPGDVDAGDGDALDPDDLKVFEEKLSSFATRLD